MDILSFGMKMELDGKAFYEEHASKVNDKNAADIFRFLAEEEQKHYDYIKKIKEGSKELPESHLVRDVKNVFQRMKERGESFVEEKATLFEVLNRGLEMEDKSIDFYRERAEASESPDDKDIFMILKKQEDQHYALLSSLIEFYDRPMQWLEDAEFAHFSDY
jgi:rubrerythrin